MYVVSKTRTKAIFTLREIHRWNDVEFILHTVLYTTYIVAVKKTGDSMFVDVVEYMEDCTVNMT